MRFVYLILLLVFIQSVAAFTYKGDVVGNGTALNSIEIKNFFSETNHAIGKYSSKVKLKANYVKKSLNAENVVVKQHTKHFVRCLAGYVNDKLYIKTSKIKYSSKINGSLKVRYRIGCIDSYEWYIGKFRVEFELRCK